MGWQGAIRSAIENQRRVRPRELRRSDHGLQRHLKLDRENLRCPDQCPCFLDVRWAKARISTWRDCNGVLAIWSESNEGHTSERVCTHANMGRIDAFAHQILNPGAADRICADPSNHADGYAAARCCDCLVRSLPSGVKLKDRVTHRLTRRRSMMQTKNVVGVDRADNDHFA